MPTASLVLALALRRAVMPPPDLFWSVATLIVGEASFVAAVLVLRRLFDR